VLYREFTGKNVIFAIIRSFRLAKKPGLQGLWGSNSLTKEQGNQTAEQGTDFEVSGSFGVASSDCPKG